VRGGGYGTNTSKWSVDLDDGRRVFVKLALDEVAAGWLRSEARFYGAVSTSFVPALVAWHDANDDTFLVLEDLTDAHWPPPWSQTQISLVPDTLDAVHATPPPFGLPLLDDMRDHLDGWPAVAADAEPLLATGLCSVEWLAGASRPRRGLGGRHACR